MTLNEQIANAEARITELWDSSERRDTNMLELIKQLLAICKELKKEIEQLKQDRK